MGVPTATASSKLLANWPYPESPVPITISILDWLANPLYVEASIVEPTKYAMKNYSS
jgi:hypothetical protein